MRHSLTRRFPILLGETQFAIPRDRRYRMTLGTLCSIDATNGQALIAPER
jgi:hypothetical protein